MRLRYLLMPLLSLLLLGSSHAFYNITFVNTTVILSGNSSAHVIETFNLYVSNASVLQYTQNRDAIGLSLSDWQNILYTNLLTQHIVSQKRSTYGFTFLPGPLVSQFGGGQALLTMSYDVNNVTTVRNIAPRKFEYTFNDSVFNFIDTVNGQALPSNVRLNLVIPERSQILMVYPLPDLPSPSSLGDYKNLTTFSWFSGEPLSQFSFSFVSTQSLQGEVLGYFSSIYNAYKIVLYAILIAAIAAILIYVYLHSGRTPEKE